MICTIWMYLLYGSKRTISIFSARRSRKVLNWWPLTTLSISTIMRLQSELVVDVIALKYLSATYLLFTFLNKTFVRNILI